MKEIEVTEKDALLAQRDEKAAYHVLLNYVFELKPCPDRLNVNKKLDRKLRPLGCTRP